jgi:hypothetical protein
VSDNVFALVGEVAGHQERRVAAQKMINMSEGSGRMLLHHPIETRHIINVDRKINYRKQRNILKGNTQKANKIH